MNSQPHSERHGASNLAQQRAMDQMYRFQRHIYDASRRFYLLGRDHLIENLHVPTGGTVLEIGCGTGRNLVKTAKRYPASFIYGFDISAEMLKSAGRAVERAALAERIRIAQGDALSFDGTRTFGVAAFDRIYCSYTLSMIPGWQQVIARAVPHLAPGGQLHIVDFGQCEQLPRLVRTCLFTWLRQFHVMPRAALCRDAAQVASEHACKVAFAARHGGYDWHLVIRRLD